MIAADAGPDSGADSGPPPGSGGAGGASTDAAIGGGGTDASGSIADAGADGSEPDSGPPTDAGGCPALHFGEDVDGVVVPSSPTMDFGTSGTLEVWVFADRGPDAGVVNGGVLFNKWVNFQEDKYLAIDSVGAPSVFLHVSSGSIANIRSSSGLQTETWAHVAFSYDPTSTRVYLDGVKVGEQLGPSVPANSTGDVQIGHVVRDATLSAFHGFYSEMRLSSVARYTADFTPESHLTADADTTALWKLDEGTGTTVADSSGNGNAGTITGATWLRAPCR